MSSPQHIHILGICGTFMGGIARIAQQLGLRVTGSDQHVYPPMSTQLEAMGIAVTNGWGEAQFSPEPDLVIVGNALSRGNRAVEYVLNRGLRYTSGAQWLSERCLQERWVLAVAGTHGKTTTSSMLAWLLKRNEMRPGFLIGGVCHHFDHSAELGHSPFFVIEADEYDTAFFDKRSKFVHYRPSTLILNNLEFDHADIFPDLAAIERQFHHLMRTVPGNGQVIVNAEDTALEAVLAKGCWSERTAFSLSSGAEWSTSDVSDDGSTFTVVHNGQAAGTVCWDLLGMHNVANGVAAIAAAHHAGLTTESAIEALSEFNGVKRRMEVYGQCRGVTVYDDFAHHPTAIATTLAGLRGRVGRNRIIAVLEPRSNTMKMGVHQHVLADSLRDSDLSFVFAPDMEWAAQLELNAGSICVASDLNALVSAIVAEALPGDHVVVMSNGGFGGIHQLLLDGLTQTVEREPIC